MNRAAALARAFLLTALLLATAAAAYPHTPSGPPTGHVTVTGVGQRNSASQPAELVLGAVTRNLVAFDKAVRYKAVLRMMYLRWGTPVFPSKAIARSARFGAQTVIELQPNHLPMQQIAAGADDAWLRQVFAPGISSFAGPVTVSFAPEMNGQWYSYGSGNTSPSDYVHAWRHVHRVLAGTTAGKFITWLWQPSAIHFTTPSPMPWWPGSRYVNEIGLDGYYVVPWDTFQAIFVQTIRLVRSVTRKPIIVAETAVGATTGRMAIDIKDLFAGVSEYHLLGFVWFNIRQNEGKYHQDWRLQDHPRALRVFVARLARA